MMIESKIFEKKKDLKIQILLPKNERAYKPKRTKSTAKAVQGIRAMHEGDIIPSFKIIFKIF